MDRADGIDDEGGDGIGCVRGAVVILAAVVVAWLVWWIR